MVQPTIVESYPKFFQEEVDIGPQSPLPSLPQHHQHTPTSLQVGPQD